MVVRVTKITGSSSDDWNESEVEAPPSVIDRRFFINIKFLSPLHVSASSGHHQKERGKLLIYQDQPVIISPIPHALLLYIGNWLH
jgi:hypothetical protein